MFIYFNSKDCWQFISVLCDTEALMITLLKGLKLPTILLCCNFCIIATVILNQWTKGINILRAGCYNVVFRDWTYLLFSDLSGFYVVKIWKGRF